MNRSTIASALDLAKVPQILMSMRKGAPSPWITVLTFHRAAQPGPGFFDDGVVDTTPEAFDKQVAFCTRWFDVVGIDELIAFKNGGKLPKNPMVITFDDGYLDNHDVVLPILQKYGAKAVFFIATSYLEERRLFWWDRISWILKSTEKPHIEIKYPFEEQICLNPKPKGIRRALRIVKDTHGIDLTRYIAELETAAGVALEREEERKIADQMLMTWDQVRALREAGMDVQSHTATHRVLQTVPEDQLEAELLGSRLVLERVLGERITAVSYPVGKPLKYTPHVRRAVADAGYELGFSNATGVNHRWDFDPLDAKRLSLDVGLGDAFFRTMVALPYFAY
jgi:peptidoglycan/xylan/chitin deacetylase (PgdA/CDA1 family)